MHDIDFVVTWVDDRDPSWRRQYERYLPKRLTTRAAREIAGRRRFRDWGLLRYWFRSVEENAPWVRTIHFVTYGHLPPWLNTHADRLHVVTHEDFIPADYLPTFNSNVIELNLHRIEDLAEHFVYFNDDFFLVRRVGPQEFFRHGLPTDFLGLFPSYATDDGTCVDAFNASLVNRHFDWRAAMMAHLGKWFCPCYGLRCLAKTLTLLPYGRFFGFQQNHLNYNLLKATFDELWECEGEVLDIACRSHFRGAFGYSPNLLRDWQRMTGRFSPCPPHFGAHFSSRQMADRTGAERLARLISGKAHPVICINDVCDTEAAFSFWSGLARREFELRYSRPSSFELSAG